MKTEQTERWIEKLLVDIENETADGGESSGEGQQNADADESAASRAPVYSRQELHWHSELFGNSDNASYTRQLMQDAQENGIDLFAHGLLEENLPDSTGTAGDINDDTKIKERAALSETLKHFCTAALEKLHAASNALLIGAAAILILAAIAAFAAIGGNEPDTVSSSSAEWSAEQFSITTVSLSDTVPAFPYSAYNYNYDFPDDESVISIADGLMNGSLSVRHTLASEPYSIDKLDWNIQSGDSPNTFQLYLQSLCSVCYLTKAYELTGSDNYLALADKFIWSWNDYQGCPALSGANSYVWNDHATAIRTENLIYYYFVADSAGCLSEPTSSLIIEMLTRHAEFLYNDDNYTENHNHGIFQDLALIYVSCFLNDERSEQWSERAQQRLEQQREYAFTQEMVHVENSPNYQLSVTDTLRTAAVFLMQFEFSYGRELYDSLAESAEFIAYITKPNGHIAEIGDTDGSEDIHSLQTNEISVSLGNGHLTYAASQGADGIQPEDSAAFYPESGYYLYHADWGRKNFNLSTWAMFKSGYSSGTHKHCDDNSFMLYTHGYDVFVDTGYYNYMPGDSYSDYFSSARAHNTVIVDGGSYSPTAENSHLTGICEYYNGDDYDYILGVNDIYSGVSFDRHFYNLGNALIIYDDLLSDEQHTYSQLFHLGETAEIISADSSEILIALGDTGARIRIRQLGSPCELSIINGADDNAEYGFISRQLNHIDTIDTLKFDQTGSNVSFVTLITIENQRGRIDGIRRISFDNGVFTVQRSLLRGKYTIELAARERADAGAVTLAVSGSDVTFTSESAGDGLEYAWELIDSVSGESIIRTEYSDKSSSTLTLGQTGEFIVRAYIRDGSMERWSAAAVISRAEPLESWSDATDKYQWPELEYNGHSYSCTGGQSYRFTVDFDYSWQYSIKWYIYKNGAYYDTVTTSSKSLNYSFTQSGSYTVMYYLRTLSGNNELWNFPAIEITSD